MNKHILPVDDDASLRATLRTCLEIAGYHCMEAKEGQDACDLLENGYPVDLIGTDHQMPKISGLELIKGVKSQVNTETIPIIFLISSPRKVDKVKRITDGFKPLPVGRAEATLINFNKWRQNRYLKATQNFLDWLSLGLIH